MRLLVLGGTRFLGRAIVDDAIRRGYDVTTFTRGLSGEPRPGAEALHGDRTRSADLSLLTRRDWDAVVDTSVLAPAHVLACARILAGHAGHYTYVSTLSVYQDRPAEIIDEESPVLACPATAEGDIESLGYGELKAGAERAVAEAFPGQSLLVRPGLIIGPHENVGRVPWWLTRIARGGTVIAPGAPDARLRMTDARDLAAWINDNTRRAIPGVVNVPGPEETTFGEFVTACAEATAPQRDQPAEFRWMPDDILLKAGAQPWTELPMWAPGTPEFEALWQVRGDRALRTGMSYRPLTDTVRDTWLWLQREAEATGKPVSMFQRAPGIGLDPGKELAILAAG